MAGSGNNQPASAAIAPSLGPWKRWKRRHWLLRKSLRGGHIPLRRVELEGKSLFETGTTRFFIVISWLIPFVILTLFTLHYSTNSCYEYPTYSILPANFTKFQYIFPSWGVGCDYSCKFTHKHIHYEQKGALVHIYLRHLLPTRSVIRDPYLQKVFSLLLQCRINWTSYLLFKFMGYLLFLISEHVCLI